MSKAKPTPMPWELRGWSVKHPGNGFRICIVEQPDKGLRQFGGGDYEEMLAECKANAELIAMAPALAAENAALRSRLAAADALRREAREWVAQTHLNDCSAGKWSLKTGRYDECDCGRDKLLTALEPPK